MRDSLRVLAIENDPQDVKLLRQHLAQAEGELGPCELIVAESLREGCERLREGAHDVAFLGLRLPDASGPDVVRRARAEGDDLTPLVVLTGSNEDTSLAAECVRAGAQDYQIKAHLTPNGLARSIHLARARFELQHRNGKAHGADERPAPAERVPATAREPHDTPPPVSHTPTARAHPTDDGHDLEGLITRSPVMLKQVEICLKAAATPATVLVLGETGTGKELLARIVHRNSRRAGNFVAVNCGAVPETLIESVLFGHERGAFTGAIRNEIGLFRHAHKGTIFLDEVGDLPLAAQGVTLRVLQERVVRPVGASREYPIDVRVIAATGVALEEAVVARRFRDDLLYRLDVVRVMVPPLRERLEDVEPLLESFCRKYSTLYKRPPPELAPGFLQALCDYSWPGNVRQLQNLAERLLVSNLSRCDADDARALLGSSVQTAPRRSAPPTAARPASAASAGPASAAPAASAAEVDETLEQWLEKAEKDYMERILRRTSGRVNAASRLAGISRRTLLRKLIKHSLDRRQFRDGGTGRLPAAAFDDEDEDENDVDLADGAES